MALLWNDIQAEYYFVPLRKHTFSTLR